MNIFLNEYFGFCFEWIFFWMNILDFVLNWIIFRPNSMKKWIFKTYRTGLATSKPPWLWWSMIRPPVHHSLAVLHQEIFPAFQSDLFPIGLGRRRVALFRISDCNIFLTMSSWHLLRLTSLIKFAHVEVNNLDIRVSGSSRLIFRKVRFDCYFACTWFKLGKFRKFTSTITLQ